MSSNQPLLGSLAMQAPSQTPQTVHVSPSTCHDLSLFKELLREYRRLDDLITMRINRANAHQRDKDRLDPVKGNLQDEACSQVWKELIANWSRRTKLVEYCVSVVDSSMEEKKRTIAGLEADDAARRKAQAQWFAEEVKLNQVHNELSVEKIIRQRSLDAFRSRCRYFVPPSTDAEASKWWDSVNRGR
ncbi:hypothetical protein BDN71DRAFT_1399049 [Pleurotus eryngii]|uniref:Coiled-coil domain-containing protein 58 n=1 Tax=Pleurotus eryngii TaxID=5323 RepID=A0A9P5ZPA7_PLEER|nr:hypothetical protein BDN71DRAFT_1399049 [Pleurotus eryngii]